MPTPSAQGAPVSPQSLPSSTLTRALHASHSRQNDAIVIPGTDAATQTAEGHHSVMEKMEDVNMSEAHATLGAVEYRDVVAQSPSSSSMDQDETRADMSFMDSNRMSFSPTTPPKPTTPLESGTFSPGSPLLSRISSNSISFDKQSQTVSSDYIPSILRPGNRFKGTQKSDKQVYNVEVEIKHVDLSESFLCGYLRIEGLTPDAETLTTFFEGEIIGPKYSFITNRPEWKSSKTTDMIHWARFPSFRPMQERVRGGKFIYKDAVAKEHIYMRWKELFLVPDHRKSQPQGASYEGFYYIDFNQLKGTISGVYYHAKEPHKADNKVQQLELAHVPDFGCTGALEFR